MSVRFYGVIPRLSTISPEEFHDHYRHPHGTHGLRNPGVLVYVQSHQFDTDLLGDEQRVYEAVAEVIFDSVESGLGLATAENYLTHLLPDEPYFIDLPGLRWLYTDEETVVEKTPADVAEERWSPEAAPFTVKLLQFLSEDDANSTDGASDAERALAVGALRFIRSVPTPEVYTEDVPAYAAVRELWWPTRWDMEQGARSAPEAWSKLIALGEGSVSLVAQAERFI